MWLDEFKRWLEVKQFPLQNAAILIRHLDKRQLDEIKPLCEDRDNFSRGRGGKLDQK